MLCEQCKQRSATVHITKVINNQKTEKHLCEVCAKGSGNELGFFFEPKFSFHNLLAGLLEGEAGILNAPTADLKEKCSFCGLTFPDFRQIGRLGCSDCYAGFSSNLDPLLRRIHGSTVHTGKVPKRAGGQIRVKKEIEMLRKKLQEAVQREAYEEAAKIRDEIRAKERESKRSDRDDAEGKN